MSHPFAIDRLDHVAIYVRDMDRSIAWYREVLGLKTVRVKAWGSYPVFMLAGQTGLAIFPANTEDPDVMKPSRNVKIEHYAFTVSNSAYTAAKAHYISLGMDFNEQDHLHFDSIYTKDPDGHTVELTTLKPNSTNFYSS